MAKVQRLVLTEEEEQLEGDTFNASIQSLNLCSGCVSRPRCVTSISVIKLAVCCRAQKNKNHTKERMLQHRLKLLDHRWRGGAQVFAADLERIEHSCRICSANLYTIISLLSRTTPFPLTSMRMPMTAGPSDLSSTASIWDIQRMNIQQGTVFAFRINSFDTLGKLLIISRRRGNLSIAPGVDNRMASMMLDTTEDASSSLSSA